MATPTSSTPWEYSTFTGNANVDSLISGTNWSGSTITYSFPSATAFWSTDVNGGYGPSNGSGEPWSAEFSPLAPSDEVAVRAAFASWGAVVATQFAESVDNANTVGDIRLAYTYGADIDGAQAYAYLPSDGPIAGDVWFNARGSSYTEEWTAGSYEAMTAMHEIGHALGLKHPFESPNVLDPALDTRSFTIMSYSAAVGDQGSYFSFEPTTPMVLDIAAIQHLYGVNSGTGAGNTTYTFQSGVNYHQTIWDSGGTDTLVYQSAVGGEIDLNAGVGGGSAMGATLYVYNSFGQQLYSYYNIWIADGTVIENATGGSGSDVLIGNQVANVLIGGAGNDTLTGDAGNDTLDGGSGNDAMAGGTGNDLYIVDSATFDLISETSTLATELDTVNSSVSWTLGANLEKLTLIGTAALNGTGNSLTNTLTGNAAANVLNGGAGADVMYGGAGNDTYYVDQVGDVVADASTVVSEIDTVISSVSWTLGANIEKLTLIGTAALNGTGNSLGNTLSGNAAANVLNGGTGADAMYGGAGNDTYYVDQVGDVVADASTVVSEIDTVISSVSWTLGANIEKLTLIGTAAVNGTGNSLGNTLSGNAAANVLNGGAGADAMYGGAGNDTYYVDQVGDVVADASTVVSEIDTVISSVSWTLGANIEKLTLIGTAAVNGTGNSLGNTLSGNAAANVLNGGAGADAMYGGAGNDTYHVDTLGDVVVDASTVVSEIDTVLSSVSWTLGANIEKLTLIGTAAVNGTGNSLGNTLSGNAAANVLNGGAGADAMYGGAGNDTYHVDTLGDVVVDASTVVSEIDTVLSSVSWTLGANIEKLTLTGTANNFGTGNTLANTLVGNSGVNVLTGGAGADTVTGGDGADIFVLSNTSGSDLITDFATGIDDLRISQAGLRVGDGDTVVEGAVSIGGPGGFSSAAEFVVVTGNIAGSITSSSAAAAIGSASSAYTVGATRLFAVDNGSSSALYLFTAADANSVVSAGELTLLASLQSMPGLGVGDLIFGG